MSAKNLAQLTDDELLAVAKNNKPPPIFDAFLIGFLVGSMIYGAAANAWGFIILVLLFLIYLFLKKPKRYESLKRELKNRSLE